MYGQKLYLGFESLPLRHVLHRGPANALTELKLVKNQHRPLELRTGPGAAEYARKLYAQPSSGGLGKALEILSAVGARIAARIAGGLTVTNGCARGTSGCSFERGSTVASDHGWHVYNGPGRARGSLTCGLSAPGSSISALGCGGRNCRLEWSANDGGTAVLVVGGPEPPRWAAG